MENTRKAYRTPAEKKLDAAAAKSEADAAALKDCAAALGWSDKEIAELARRITMIGIEQRKRLEDQLMAVELKKQWQGRTMYFNPQHSFSLDITLRGRDRNCLNGATSAKFYHYQPRAKRVWLQFSEADLKNSEWKRVGGPLMHFTLRDAVRMNLTTTPPTDED